MSKPGPQPTQARVRELFSDNGEALVWRVFCNNRTPAGTVVRTETKDGYVVVRFDGRRHYAHRVLWIHRHGEIPEDKHIDHVNGVRSDNRPDNHRLVEAPQNSWNQRRMVTNTSGVKGVSWNAREGLWEAKVIRDGERYFLGRHRDLAHAENLVRSKRETLHGQYTNHGDDQRVPMH